VDGSACTRIRAATNGATRGGDAVAAVVDRAALFIFLLRRIRCRRLPGRFCDSRGNAGPTRHLVQPAGAGPARHPSTTGSPCRTGATQTPPNIFNSFVTMREFPDEDPYFFDLVAGDRVVVTLDADPSAGADPFIRLVDPSGTEIDFDDDDGGGLNSLIDTVVSQSGTFTVFYQSVGSTGPGPGQITVLIN
jgi:hypothetical protein